MRRHVFLSTEVLCEYGTNNFSTDRDSRGRPVTKDHRRVHWPVNSAASIVSIPKMTTPSGWREPGQTPEFDEYTVVLKGQLQVETRKAVHEVSAGQAIIVNAGEWVRYSTPGARGADDIAGSCT